MCVYVDRCVRDKERQRHPDGDRRREIAGQSCALKSSLCESVVRSVDGEGQGRDKGTEPRDSTDASTAQDCTVSTSSAGQNCGFRCSRTPGCPPA